MANCSIPSPNVGKFWIEGVAIPLVGTFGTIGNLLAISVLLSKRLQIGRSIQTLLIMLAIFDTISVISIVIWMSPGTWSHYYKTHIEYVQTYFSKKLTFHTMP